MRRNYGFISTNRMTLCPDTLSNFIYVDLFDRRNKLISSKKIKRDSVGFANNLYISDTLSAGEYTLQAYTGWMLNFDPSCFFQKNILIGRTASDIRTDITYQVLRFSATKLPMNFSTAMANNFLRASNPPPLPEHCSLPFRPIPP